MDTDDFPASPAKRQRTDSPEENRSKMTSEVHMEENRDDPNISIGSKETSGSLPIMEITTSEIDQNSNNPALEPQEDPGFLDVLMQHVEAESSPKPISNPVTNEASNTSPPSMTLETATDLNVQSSAAGELNRSQQHNIVESAMDLLENTEDKVGLLPESSTVSNGIEVTESAVSVDKTEQTKSQSLVYQQEQPIEVGNSTAGENLVNRDSTTNIVDSSMQTNSMEVNPGLNISTSRDSDEEAQWEVDSSPYESDSDSDSDSSSDGSSTEESDESEDADGDYAMLDPEEQARILMQGDAGSDDEDGKSKEKSGTNLRTANEKIEDIIPKPDIEVTEDMEIEELGTVHGSVEATVLLKAKVTGEYQVLESGSLLCLKDRTVLGVVTETLGRVEQPMYTIRFTDNQAIEEAGLSTLGTIVYYVKQHSTFVFTQPLKGIKGSDASNFHDEEVGEEEMEFSDDEAEAAYKRQLKMKRLGRRDESGKTKASRGGRGGSRGSRYNNSTPRSEADGTAYGNGSLEMNYDDVPDGDGDGYTPLARPTNLHAMMGSDNMGEGFHSTHPLPYPPMTSSGTNQSRGKDRFRGGRARGHRGNQGYRGGGFHHNKSQDPLSNSQAQIPPNAYSAQTNHSVQPLGPPPLPSTFSYQNQQYLFQSPPSAPVLPPQNSPYQSTPFSPSPISPLPKQQFGFGGYNPVGSFPPSQQHQNQSYPGGFQNSSFNQRPQFNHQPYQQQHANPNANFHQTNQWNMSNNLNQAAAAEVQKRLEEMSRGNNISLASEERIVG